MAKTNYSTKNQGYGSYQGSYGNNYGNSSSNQSSTNSGFRVPPHSLEAEKAVLGSIMLKQDAIYDVADIVNADSFYSEKHRMIFVVMIDLSSKHEPIDLLSVRSKLEEAGQLDQIGGASYLAELVHCVPSAANIEHYAGIVRKKFLMRNLIDASEFISQVGYEEQGDVEEILDLAEKRIFEITNTGTKKKNIELKHALEETWNHIDKLHNSKDEIRGVKTGFRDLDSKLAGLQKSDLIILAARPSVGKTSFALDIARHAATEEGTPVCIFSLEMSAQQLAQRMLSAASRVDAWKLRTAKNLNDNDFELLQHGIGKLSQAPIYIDDQAGNNIIKMRSFARRLKAEKGLGLIIVDYLQLMAPTLSRQSDNMVQQVTEISRSLKHLARELDVPVLALSQLSRAVEQRGGKPRLSDLRDSGSIEQDADLVMFIHREDRYKEHDDRDGVAEILIEKHRNGPTGVVKLKFDSEHTTFLTMEKSDFGDFADHVDGGM